LFTSVSPRQRLRAKNKSTNERNKERDNATRLNYTQQQQKSNCNPFNLDCISSFVQATTAVAVAAAAATVAFDHR